METASGCECNTIMGNCNQVLGSINGAGGNRIFVCRCDRKHIPAFTVAAEKIWMKTLYPFVLTNAHPFRSNQILLHTKLRVLPRLDGNIMQQENYRVVTDSYTEMGDSLHQHFVRPNYKQSI